MYHAVLQHAVASSTLSSCLSGVGGQGGQLEGFRTATRSAAASRAACIASTGSQRRSSAAGAAGAAAAQSCAVSSGSPTPAYSKCSRFKAGPLHEEPCCGQHCCKSPRTSRTCQCTAHDAAHLQMKKWLLQILRRSWPAVPVAWLLSLAWQAKLRHACHASCSFYSSCMHAGMYAGRLRSLMLRFGPWLRSATDTMLHECSLAPHSCSSMHCMYYLPSPVIGSNCKALLRRTWPMRASPHALGVASALCSHKGPSAWIL